MGKEAPHCAHLLVSGQRIYYALKRSARRRTVTLTIDAEQGLVVYCPSRFAVGQLEDLIREKAGWISSKLAEAEQARASRKRWLLTPGAELPYLGQSYPVVWLPSAGMDLAGAPDLRLHDGKLWLSAPGNGQTAPSGNAFRDRLVAGYRSAARREIEARLPRLAEPLGVWPANVRIKNQKRRWGSCSAKGGLNFNWKLVLMPNAIMEYVIVHELCHLRELNHSPLFWDLVGSIVPSHRQHRAWLRTHGTHLNL